MIALDFGFETDGYDVQPTQKPWDALREALKEGRLDTAMKILDGLERVELMEAVLRAGFALGGTKNRKEIYADLQPELVQAAKLKMDGFELREYKEALKP